MNEIVNLFSAYDIMGHVIPGTIFVYYIQYRFQLSFLEPDNVFVFLVLSFIVGVLIGRISSIVLEKPLSKIVKISHYRFIGTAENIDNSLHSLKSFKNLIRNLISLICLVGIVEVIYLVFYSYSIIRILVVLFFVVVGLFLLIKSYQKSSKYMSKRIFNVITSQNPAIANIQKEEKKFTYCPYCKNRNNIEIENLNYEVCYRCSGRYLISKDSEI